MRPPPTLTNFRIEESDNGIAHLIFDVPDRRFNILSNAAIAELGVFADWLATGDARGVVVRSGKDNGFCAGSDLVELGAGYDLVAVAPEADRDAIAFDQFFRLSAILRKIETSGKPVAAAIAGIALGGGSELALACHYRVLADDPKATFGQPESMVGLMPGAGGTQRLPRLIGVEQALPVLLHGSRLGGTAAVHAGIADELVQPGDEILAAERWILSQPSVCQPWDKGSWDPDAAQAQAATDAFLDEIRTGPRAHAPAPYAIVEAIQRGFPQGMDQAIRTEMEIFVRLIQRPEPRNTIRTFFFGKLDYDKRVKNNSCPAEISAIAETITGAIHGFIDMVMAQGRTRADIEEALVYAGFTKTLAELPANAVAHPRLPPRRNGQVYWFEQDQNDSAGRIAADLILTTAGAAEPWIKKLAEADLRAIDYGVAQTLGYPEYLGGPLDLAKQLSTACESHS